MKRDILKEIPPKQFERLVRLIRLKLDLEKLRELKKSIPPREPILPS
jgi:hypothetical protein